MILSTLTFYVPSSLNLLSVHQVEPPEGYFSVVFIEKIASRYTSGFSFRSGLQEDNVCRSLHDDPDRMYEAQESMKIQPNYRIFPENPL